MVFANRSALFVAASLLAVTSPTYAAYPDCFAEPPTAAALDSWRNAAASAVSGNNAQVATSIKTCFPTAVPTCLKRTLTVATQNDLASSSQDARFEDVPERHPPAELLAPGGQAFEYFVRTDIEAFARSRDWPVVRYKSRHSGGFDSETASLLMVYVPGDKVTPPVNFDRWINFALPADTGAAALDPLPQATVTTPEEFAAGAGTFPRTFTMISLTKPTATEPAELYFQMFRRNGNTGNYTNSGNSGLGGCISCHPNGMRAISPLGFHVRAGEPQLPPDDWRAVQIMNEAMDNAGGKLVSWRSAVVDANGTRKAFMKPEAYWPVVGATKPLNGFSRTQAFIMGGTLPDGTVTPGCYKARPTIRITDIFGRPPGQNNIYTLSASPLKDWRKVRNAMSCESCHNNRTRYSLNSLTDQSTIDYKILTDQSMPPKDHQDPMERGDPTLPPTDNLSLDERISLANCLQAEMAVERPLLQKWLTQEVCQ